MLKKAIACFLNMYFLTEVEQNRVPNVIVVHRKCIHCGSNFTT